MARQQTSDHLTSIWEPCYAPPPPLPRRRKGRGGAILYGLLTIITILGLLLVVFNAKPALAQGSVQLIKVDVSVVGKGYRAGKLIGTTVTNDKNENIGKLDDIIIDKNRVMYAVVQVGGFLGVGSRLVAVPYDSLQIDDTGKKVVLPGATKDELKKLAEFKYLT
jgi:hypothetical protein